jgi:hypothetical protein
VTRYAYLAVLLLSVAGVAFVVRRFGLKVDSRLVVRAVALTVPLFLVVDAIGAARGWFFSNPSLSIAIFSPGISLEEPLLLGFLAFLSIVLYQALAKAR